LVGTYSSTALDFDRNGIWQPDTNAAWMNTALSELLQKVFSDTALDHFLTTGS
jgi:hypothetical protein